jgi:predicted MPP superfamily phosphohydrolase
MKMIFYFIIGTMLAVYGGINYYIGFWLWKHIFIKIPLITGKVYWTVFFMLVVMSLIGVVWNNYLPHFLQDGFYMAASYWLGAVVYFSIFIAIFELIHVLGKCLKVLPLAVARYNTTISFAAGILVLVTTIVFLIYGTLNARKLEITTYNINISKQAGSLKQLHVAFLSDIHLGNLQDNHMKELVDTINKINPDLVLIGGDMVDASRDMESYEAGAAEYNFKKIKSKYGIYASLGNHDYDDNGDSEYRIERFKQAGINVLRDDSVKIGDSFYLIGREDKSYERISGRKRKQLSMLMKDMDVKFPVIVLDHQPIELEEPRDAGADLQLSGHTHRGQLFPFNLVTKKIFQVDYGYLKIGNFQVIVSSGARTWGPPIRIGSHSEVADITIYFQ